MCRADSLQPEANGISGRLRRNPARADRYSPVPFHTADSAADQDAASNGDSDRLRSVDEDLPQASIKVALPFVGRPARPPRQTVPARFLMQAKEKHLSFAQAHTKRKVLCAGRGTEMLLVRQVRLRHRQLQPEQPLPGPSEPQGSMPRSLACKENEPSGTRLTSNPASQSPESEVIVCMRAHC